MALLAGVEAGTAYDEAHLRAEVRPCDRPGAVLGGPRSLVAAHVGLRTHESHVNCHAGAADAQFIRRSSTPCTRRSLVLRSDSEQNRNVIAVWVQMPEDWQSRRTRTRHQPGHSATTVMRRDVSAGSAACSRVPCSTAALVMLYSR